MAKILETNAQYPRSGIRRANAPAKRRKWVIPVLLALILVVGGAGGFFYYQKVTAAAAATPAAQTTKTAAVRRGSITLSASGTGVVVPSLSASLSFSSSGTVGTLNVQVGDHVQKGQVLAQLADLSPLNAAVASANLNLQVANQALTDLTNQAASTLANAQLNLDTANKAYTDAQSGLIAPGTPRCDATTTSAYYEAYLKLKNALDALPAGDNAYYLNVVLPAKIKVESAFSQYTYCTGYTNYEVSSSQAKLALADAALKTAQSALQTLVANQGIDPIAKAQAENNIASAQLALTQAQKNLDGATLKAPFTGTILTVAGQVGDSVATSAFITMADLDHPMIQFTIDETDMGLLKMGEAAKVTFDAIPNTTFTGKVVRINPALVTVSGYQAIQGLIQLDAAPAAAAGAAAAATATPQVFTQGLNGAVQIIGGQANNVLLVPIEAVRDLGGGQFAVFIMKNGTPKLTVVEVGLKDTTYAEIKSGVALGDTVTTGITGTK